MNDRFKDIPRDEGIKTLFSSPMKWGALDIVYEKWNWDGIAAESIIFLNEDVKGLDDEALEADVRNGPLVQKDSQVTVKRLKKYTFVNFNFKT